MRTVITIAVSDLRVFLSDSANYVNLAVMPVILALVLGFALGQDEAASAIRVDLIDEDQSEQSAQFVAALRRVNETLRICPMDDSEDYDCHLDQLEDWEDGDDLSVEQSRQRIQDKVVAALIVIPDGYGEGLQHHDSRVNIGYYSLETITSGSGVLQSIEAVVQRVNGASVAVGVGTSVVDALSQEDGIGPIMQEDPGRAEFEAAVYEDALQMWETPPVQISYDLAQTDAEDEISMGFNQSVPGMATMFVMFTALGGLGLLLVERKQWTLQRLVVMPITRAQLLAGKILARFITGMITFAIMTVVGLITGLNWGNDPIALALVMIAYALCITAFTFAIAPLIRSEEQAGGLTVLLSIILAALGGAWWPLSIVPEFMQVIGHVSPIAWAMDAFTELIVYGGGLTDVLTDVGVLLGIAVVLFGIGIRNFQYE
jgi:ABC-2 type transport system permease protein